MKRDIIHLNISGEAGRSSAAPSGGKVKAPARPGPVPSKPAVGRKPGFTLIELLVASVIMVVVTGAALTLFKISATYERRQQELLTQTQNLRAALYVVARDVRMAGSGLPMIGSPTINVFVGPDLFDEDTQELTSPAGWFAYAGSTSPGARAIFGTNSDKGTDKTKSDTLTIFRSEVESTASIGQLREAFTPGSSSQVRLKQRVTEGEVFVSGDIWVIADGLNSVIVQVVAGEGENTNNLTLGERFNPGSTAMPGNVKFPPGSMVYNLRDITLVTYYVDTDNHRLMANYHDATLKDLDADGTNQHLVTVADNIEDFQVAYFTSTLGDTDLTLTADPDLSRLNSGAIVVRAVQIAMVSRSQAKSQVGAEGSAVEVMGHTAKEDKGYTRRVLTETVQLRNFRP